MAKTNGFDFKVILDSSLDLSKYLGESKIKWIGSKDDLSYSLRNSRLLAYNGDWKIPLLNKRIKQYHIVLYSGRDIMIYNKVQNWKKVWKQCFDELFLFKDSLIELYNDTGLARGGISQFI